MSNSKEEAKKNTWTRFGMRLALNTACHPFEYAKVLIQIGYEPIPARATTTLFGRSALVLPNVFQYVSYIKGIDGLSGCYRGLTPKLLGNVVSVLSSEKIAEQLGLGATPEKEDVNDDELTDTERRKKFEKSLSRDLILHISGTIISHPFQVVTVRMMSQFIGRETKYYSILGSFATIYQDEGIGGFFNGLCPRLLGDIACLLFASAVTFIINKHLVHDKETRSYVGAIATFITSTIMYPFQVVSNCMALSGSNLAASKPPHMPIFNNWQDCWAYLKQRGELKRGSSLLWRFWRPPTCDLGPLTPIPPADIAKSIGFEAVNDSCPNDNPDFARAKTST